MRVSNLWVDLLIYEPPQSKTETSLSRVTAWQGLPANGWVSAEHSTFFKPCAMGPLLWKACEPQYGHVTGRHGAYVSP